MLFTLISTSLYLLPVVFLQGFLFFSYIIATIFSWCQRRGYPLRLYILRLYLSLILPGRYLEDESPLVQTEIHSCRKKLNTWHVNAVPLVSLFFFFWLVKTEITDQCMTIRYNNFWKKCNISIIMLPFEFELMCTLFRTVVTAQYFPTNRIRIHILSFYWYVWNSVFDLIWFLRDISYQLRWADLKVVDKIILIVSLELSKGFDIL